MVRFRRGEVDWERLDRRMRSHNRKLALYDLIHFLDNELLKGTDIELRERISNRGRHAETVKESNRRKQDGFYVNVSVNGSTSPEDSISPNAARQLVHATIGTVALFKQSELRLKI